MAWPQNTEELSIQLGVIRAVNITEASGSRKATANVMSLLDFFVMNDIPLDSPLHSQYIPVIGQYVLLLRSANNFTRIMAYFGEKMFGAPIQPGEYLSEGSGGGFVYLDNQGDVTIGDGCMSNIQRIFSGIGINITADGYSLDVKNVGKINITPKNEQLSNEEQIEIMKTKDGDIVGKMTLTNDKIEVTRLKGGNAKGQVILTDDNVEMIKLSGTDIKGRVVLTDDKTMVYSSAVELGKDPDTPAGILDIKGGAVVSLSGVPGYYNFDMMTGAPIPCSQTVKMSK